MPSTTTRIQIPQLVRSTLFSLTYCADIQGIASSFPQQANAANRQNGLLFVHDIDEPNVEDSLLCLHRHVALLYEHGGRGVRVLIYKRRANHRLRDDGDTNKDEMQKLVTRFELELSYQYGQDIHWSVSTVENMDWHMPLGHAVTDAVLELERTGAKEPQLWEGIDSWTVELGVAKTKDSHDAWLDGIMDKQEKPADVWWNDFLHGTIAPWTHHDYLRGIFLTLLQPDNKDKDVLDVAMDFAKKMNAFKQRPVLFPQKPENRHASTSASPRVQSC